MTKKQKTMLYRICAAFVLCLGKYSQAYLMTYI